MQFSRNRRLITKENYTNVFDNPYKINQKHFLILFKPNLENHARLGLVIGKRVANHAVTRNKIKRIIRESFRLNQKKFKNLDIIVIGRQQCDTLNKIKLREGIEKLWEKLLIFYLPS